MFGGGPPPEQKADGGEATALMQLLNVAWQYDQIVYDRNNPHSEFAHFRRNMYSSHGRDTNQVPKGRFSESNISQKLQDLVMLYPGSIVDRAGRSEQEFIPLLKTSGESGLLDWDKFTSQASDSIRSRLRAVLQINPNPRRRDDENRMCWPLRFETRRKRHL